MTLDQLEIMLIQTAVDKAHGNLSAAARLLGLTRPQLAYRLKRLHEIGATGSEPDLLPAAERQGGAA
jgi:transcriptional regulator with GAF, ATPase, and Fis domain